MFKTINLILFFALLFLAGCTVTRRFGREEKTAAKSNAREVRVLLQTADKSIRFSISGGNLYDAAGAYVSKLSGNILSAESDVDEVLLSESGKKVTGRYFTMRPSAGSRTLKVDGKFYRGGAVLSSHNGTLYLVNTVPLEEYLKSVVPSEMPLGSGRKYFEALKAFAVCARTYAINRIAEAKDKFDFYPDVRDQVYNGAGEEKKLSNEAVDATNGMIVTYNGKPAEVFYSASCGGHTADASDVFSVKELPYLKGVKDGEKPNCSIAPGFNWKQKFPPGKLIDLMKSAGYLGSGTFKLENAEIESRYPSGRVKDLRFYFLQEQGREKTVDLIGNKIRYVLKPDGENRILKSTLFDLSVNGGGITFTGKGSGHGVGLCQWGAIRQSIEGRSYKHILSFYFPGTEVGRNID